MSTDPGAASRSARDYARTLERALADLHDGPVVFTHRDWDLANRWHARGIPVGVVLDAIEAKRKRPPRGLGAIATAVEESWEVVESGRIEPPSCAPSTGRPVATSRDDETLPAAIAPDVREACEREVDARLAPYRGRMPPDRFEATRRRALDEALRRARRGAPSEPEP